MGRPIPLERAARVAMNPVQLQVLEFFAVTDPPWSAKEICDELHQRLSNVSYHVTQLEKLGFIRLVDTAPRRGGVDHFYELALRVG